jgi:hypothetical protein
MDRKIRDDAEYLRLTTGMGQNESWRRWGPFLSDRQWATVREDYSPGGTAWEYFPHDHARSRAYRWGEDGLLGICDRRCRLCFAIALWNGRDPILKERLFGLTGNEGNHGEDVKECYYYLDATPTASYLKALYKYPQEQYPYTRLVDENRRRGRHDPEFELIDTGVFDDNRYFDVLVEYAKASPEDILIKITVCNRGPEAARLHLLPTLWFRNTWSWGREGDDYWERPIIWQPDSSSIRAEHDALGNYLFWSAPLPGGEHPQWLFTENESNPRLWGADTQGYFKDAFHEYVVNGRREAVNPDQNGTKAAALYELLVPARGEQCVRLRLTRAEEAGSDPFGGFDQILARRKQEADQFYDAIFRWVSPHFVEQPQTSTLESNGSADPPNAQPVFADEERHVIRQAMAGLVWSCQFYHFIVSDWLEGDPSNPPPPPQRLAGRNHDWGHLYCRDVMSMPDKWEYPWFAAWDLAFHTIAYAAIDPEFAKRQLELVMSERLMHPNGQIPAYEWAFADVNPPVHGWAAYRLYKFVQLFGGDEDRLFLSRTFQKLLLGFTWWVNRKDPEGKNIFAGGFLGLDNIGAFDRSKPLPTGGQLQQADGTAWMAFYCANMLTIATELAYHDPAYEDIAYKFFEHFTTIVSAINNIGGEGLWNEEDGFYYDHLVVDHKKIPLKVRSMVGLIPVLAAAVLETRMVEKLPELVRRIRWFMRKRPKLMKHLTLVQQPDSGNPIRALLAIPTRDQLIRVMRYVLDEEEFLSPYGIRSISKYHTRHPFVFVSGGEEYRVDYQPGESNTALFGGNSNWRGPIWFPINYLLMETLEIYYLFYGDELKVECPTGSGRMMNLMEVAHELGRRLGRIFLPGENGRRPCHGDDQRYATDPHWKDLALFYEYFHGDTGRGLGASHQTGWTAVVVRCFHRAAQRYQRFQFEPYKALPDS